MHAKNTHTIYAVKIVNNDHAIYSTKYNMSLLTASKLKLPK